MIKIYLLISIRRQLFHAKVISILVALIYYVSRIK